MQQQQQQQPQQQQQQQQSNGHVVRRKSVSVEMPLSSQTHTINENAHEKLLSRKPTPFNSDLAAAIRNSGLNCATHQPSLIKSVSLQTPMSTDSNPNAHRKILARKPTPFNSDLAAAIRNSGLGAAQPSVTKSVSLQSPTGTDVPMQNAITQRKLLSRKPTPFNSDLATAIRNSGLAAVTPSTNDESNDIHDSSEDEQHDIQPMQINHHHQHIDQSMTDNDYEQHQQQHQHQHQQQPYSMSDTDYHHQQQQQQHHHHHQFHPSQQQQQQQQNDSYSSITDNHNYQYQQSKYNYNNH